jgi:hypothetical protein
MISLEHWWIDDDDDDRQEITTVLGEKSSQYHSVLYKFHLGCTVIKPMPLW